MNEHRYYSDLRSHRVLFFGSCYGCGLTSLLAEQARALSRLLGNGVLCLSDPAEQFPGLFHKLRTNSVAVQVIPGLDSHRDLGRLVSVFRQLVDDFCPTVVHVQSNWQLLVAVIVKRRSASNFRIVYWVHGYRHNHPFKAILAIALLGAGLSVFANKVVVSASCVKRRFRFLERKLWSSPLGVDPAFFENYRSFNSESKTKRLVFAGEFRSGKNQQDIIVAVSDYCRITKDRDVELVLPGQGPLRNECQKLAANLRITDKVLFPGQLNRAEMISAYLDSQIAVVPTNQETFGHCIAEPLVLGRIVISRKVGCAEDFIVHGQNGFLFKSTQDLSNLLIEILPNLNKLRSLGEKAHECGSQLHWDVICRHYLEMLDALCINTVEKSIS